jgi:extracellular elastinolytic metalloproteinase
MNNANFATPPDGQSGTMNMYKFDLTNPNRDGSLDNVIPLHEFTHGISNRLTGGRANGRCLQSTESGGMGEGWSDAVGVYLTRSAKDTRTSDVSVGWYVIGKSASGNGIRQYPYSTNMKTNPHKYSDFNKSNEVHNIGEIWATILYDMYWNLVDTKGFSANWLDATQSQGNIVAMQLLIGGLMRQPCNPTFIQARDAILQADVDFYQGANKCAIWAAFAKRGLGSDAVQSGHKDGFKLGGSC